MYEGLTMKKFNEAIEVIMNLKTNKSLALDDIVGELHKCVMKTKLTDEMKMFLVSRMAEIEYRIA